MSENKKSFILYCDLLHTVNKLPNDKAGELFKHILEYVNGLDPESDDLITQISFEPIKQSLKRDLEKWQTIKQKRSDAGKQGGRPKKQIEAKKANALFEKQSKAKKAVSVNVSDSVNVNVNDNVIDKNSNTAKFDFMSSLIEQGTDPVIANEFMQVRKAKKAFNTETAFKALLREIKASNKDFGYIIQLCVESSWSGFKNAWLKNSNEPKKIQADLKKDITPSFRIMN